MKKTVSIFLVLLMLCSLCGVSALADDASDVVGTYRLVSFKAGDQEITEELIALMESAGKTATLTVNEDGSALMDLFGETMELTFDFAAGTAGVDGDVLNYTLDGDLLTMGDEETTLVFSKAEAVPERGVGPFRYFVAVDVLDAAGKSILDEYVDDPADAENVTLTIFNAGDAIFSDIDEEVDMDFDFDTMTFTVVGDDESFVFRLEDSILYIENMSGDTIVMEQADPGWAGPYELTDMSEDLMENFDMEGMENADLYQMLRVMGMMPTLTIDENGHGTLSMFYQTMELEFDFDAMTVSSEGEPIPFTYENGTLSFGMDGSFLTFGRVPADGE